jgi:HEAT repeat protein
MATRVRSNDVVVHTVKVLGQTDENALKYLDSVLKSALKAKTPQVERYEACFEALGKIASPKSIKTLTDYLKYKEDDVIAQAARALEGYKDAKGAYRKEIFEELLKISEGLYNSAQQNTTSPQAKKWRIIGNSMMDAMKKVSRKTDLTNPQDARRWFNEVKKQNWDKLDG